MTDSKNCQHKANNHIPAQLIELAKATFEPVKAENYRRTSEAWNKVDATRQGDGKETYNAKRKREYAEAAEADGRQVRSYGVPDSEAKKAKRTAANTQRMREKRRAAAEVTVAGDALSDDDIAWLAEHSDLSK